MVVKRTREQDFETKPKQFALPLCSLCFPLLLNIIFTQLWLTGSGNLSRLSQKRCPDCSEISREWTEPDIGSYRGRRIWLKTDISPSISLTWSWWMAMPFITKFNLIITLESGLHLFKPLNNGLLPPYAHLSGLSGLLYIDNVIYMFIVSMSVECWVCLWVVEALLCGHMYVLYGSVEKD
jgi:hypothetical protein